jgi:hypothetical protein
MWPVFYQRSVARGSTYAEELADQTIDRVASKLPEIRTGYVGDPIHYFCGVANNIFRESLRRERAPAIRPPTHTAHEEDYELDYGCLEQYINKLSETDRGLVRAYYQHSRRAKIDHRKKLAEEMGIASNALRIRMCRIRSGFVACVERCRTDSKA